ncbi:MAG: hypothetical protein K0S63_1101 [Gammaproteobacteria bacterium]|jgi:hypothetical protein|nr:hypothetical protein [Gammaproteobacteria bacterium]
MSHTRINNSDQPNYATFPGALMPPPRRRFHSPHLIQDKFGNDVIQNCEEMQNIARHLNQFWKKPPEKENALQEESKSTFADEMITALDSLCEEMDSYLLTGNTDELKKKLIPFNEKVDLLDNKLQALKEIEAYARPTRAVTNVILRSLGVGSLLSGFGTFCGMGMRGLISGQGCDISNSASTIRKEIWLQRAVDCGNNIIIPIEIEACLPSQPPQNAAALSPDLFR